MPGTTDSVKMSKKVAGVALEAVAAHSRARPAVERQRRQPVGQTVAGSDDVERLSGGERKPVHQAEVEIAEQRGRAADEKLAVFGSRRRTAEEAISSSLGSNRSGRR